MQAKMALRYLIVVLIWMAVVSAQNNCCEGPVNAVAAGKCKDGSNITGISCKRKYVLMQPANGSFKMDSSGALIDYDEAIPVAEFCLTREANMEAEIALVCFTERNNPNENEDTYVFRAACALISVIFLTATTIVYILVPNLRDLQGKCLLNSIVALAMAMLLLCIMQFGVFLPDNPCHAVGYLTFGLFLAAFTWLNIISFHIWRTTVLPSALGTERQWFLIYCIYGYGLPLILVLAAIIGHHSPGEHIRPGIGEQSCWFATNEAMWAYFYGPIAVLLAANIIFFCWTVKKLWTDIRVNDNDLSKIKSARYKCLLYIKLFFIMGLSWVFEILSFAFNDADHFMHYVWMVTDFINALQGVLIFLILVVFRKRALRGLAKRNLGCIQLPSQWRTLHDEEADEVVEEEKLTNGNGVGERFYHPKEVQSV